jgi:thioesterase domain-containing protein
LALPDEQRKVARETARNLIRLSLVTYAAAIAYRPRVMPDAFVLFSATEVTPFLAQETLAMGRHRGWDRISPDTLQCVPVEGSHQSMIAQPQVAAMCAVINGMLARETGATASSAQQTSTSRRYAS